MKFYVATSSQNIPAARECMAVLEELGHTITLDWTKEFDKPIQPCATLLALHDRLGVKAADALIFLNHPTVSAGAWCEYGLALGQGKPVYAILGEDVWPGDVQNLIFLFSEGVRMYQTVPNFLYWEGPKFAPQPEDSEAHEKRIQEASDDSANWTPYSQAAARG